MIEVCSTARATGANAPQAEPTLIHQATLPGSVSMKANSIPATQPARMIVISRKLRLIDRRGLVTKTTNPSNRWHAMAAVMKMGFSRMVPRRAAASNR